MYPSIISLASIRLFAVYLAQWVYQDSNLEPFGYEPSALTIAPQTLDDIMLQNHTHTIFFNSWIRRLGFPLFNDLSCYPLHIISHPLCVCQHFLKKSNLQVDQLRDVAPHLLSGIIRYHQTIMLQSNNVWHHDYLFRCYRLLQSRNLRHLLSALFTLSYLILKVNSIFNKSAILDMGAQSRFCHSNQYCFCCLLRISEITLTYHIILFIVRVRICTLHDVNVIHQIFALRLHCGLDSIDEVLPHSLSDLPRLLRT